MILRRFFESMNFFCVVFLPLWFPTGAVADDYVLFEPGPPSGRFVKNYDEVLQKINSHFSASGSHQPIGIIFSNGDKKIINGYLGQGTNSIIFSTHNHALRLPIHSAPEYQKELNVYHSVYSKLAQSTHKDEFLFNLHGYYPSEFVEVDRLNIEMDYAAYRKKHQNCQLLSDEFDRDIYDQNFFDEECDYCEVFDQNQKLIQLAQSLSEFSFIGDLIPENVVLVKNPDGSKRWALSDFSEPVYRYDSQSERPNHFNIFKNLKIPNKGPLALDLAIARAVSTTRNQGCQRIPTIEIAQLGSVAQIIEQLCIEQTLVKPQTQKQKINQHN